MKKDYNIFLDHILESIMLIEEYIANKKVEDFKKSVQLQDSIIRRLEIIGEAIKNIPTEFKEKNQEIPWKKIMSMRDILINHYFGVDLDLTWEVVNKDIPELKNNLLKIKKKIK